MTFHLSLLVSQQLESENKGGHAQGALRKKEKQTEGRKN